MVLAMLQKIEKYLSINLEVLLLYIKNLIKFINIKFKFKYLIMTLYWDVYTPFVNKNAFLDIENELVNFIEKDMKCALVGDFNAKTGFFFKIFSEPDETYLNVMDVNVEDGLFRYHIAMTTKFYLTIIFP